MKRRKIDIYKNLLFFTLFAITIIAAITRMLLIKTLLVHHDSAVLERCV
jgi:hypothetical protein